MFCKKPIVFCGIFVVAFCLGIDVATALCNRYNPVGPGKYCQHTVEYTCPKNCYCKGTTKGEKLSITWADGVSKGCSNRWSKVNSELCNDRYGVCLCPEGTTSNAGAKSKNDCFKVTDTTSSDTATQGKSCSNSNPAPVGSYCGALLTKKCKPGCYCTGGGNFTWVAGDVEKGCRDRWSKVTSELNSKGVKLCPEGYTSVEGAGKLEDCFLNGHSDIKYKPITCAPGTYLPANSKECAPCPTDDKKICPGAKSVYPSSTLNQDLKPCPANQVSNATRTECVDREKEYIECPEGEYAVVATDRSKCKKCHGNNYVCPGGKWEKTIGEHGLEECRGNTKPNADKTACEGITVTCQAGEYIPANSIECTKCKDAAEAAGKLCKGGTLTPSNTEAVGLSTCSGTMVPNPDHTNCVAPPPDSYECSAGQYLPKNTKECAPCPEKHTCGGGTFVFNETTDQGADPVIQYAIPKEVLAYGEHDKDAPLKDHCWYIANPDKYKECVMKGIQKTINEIANILKGSDDSE